MKKTLSLFVICLFTFSSLSARQRPGKELSGLLLSYMQVEDTHPDSLESNIQKLKARRAQSADAAERAVYAAAIGRLYAERVMWRSVGTDLRDSSIVWYAQALAEKEVLAQTKAKRWKPLVIIGRDEGYFGGDMLNVVWRSMVGSVRKNVRDTCQALPKYDEMVDFYRSMGRREGALLLALDSLYEKNGEVTEADLLRLRDDYADLPLCAEVYLRLGTDGQKTVFQRREWLQQGIAKYPKYRRKSALQNALTQLSDPFLQWNGAIDAYPGRPYVWKFTARNVQSVLINGEEHTFPAHDPIETFQDSIVWTAPSPGWHKFEFLPRTTAKLTEKVKPLTHSVKVSRLQMVYQVMPDERVRLLVLDAESGRPRPGVTIKACDPNHTPFDIEHPITDSAAYFTGKTDERGMVLVPRLTKNGRLSNQLRFQMACDDETPDMHMHTLYLYNVGRWTGAPKDSTHSLHLYTDRSIYRPGQTVHVGGIAYDQLDWEGRVRQGATYTLELYDATYKQVEKREVTTDEMGVFSADFDLPEGAKNGYFQVRVKGQGSIGFRVEEYKRPTFEVTLGDSLRVEGDSVVVSGVAKTYEGSPLRGARVTGTYQWRTPWIYYGKRFPQSEALPLDTIETDDSGRFVYKLRIKREELSDSSPSWQGRRSLSVNVDVLSQHGESHDAQHWYWRVSPPTPKPETVKVDSTFLVRCLADTFALDRPGRIEVTTNLRDVYLHYTLSAAGQVWADTMVCLSRGTVAFDIPYRAEYDQSATASFCFVKDEAVYTNSRTLYLAQPDKRLRMRWDTFRDLLQPGQKEEWRLTLLNPDGTPARANVMMAMYDASLDYFARHEWHFDFYRGNRTYGVKFQPAGWRSRGIENVRMDYYQKTRKEKDIRLSELDSELFAAVRAYTRAGGHGPILYKAANTAMLASAAPMAAATESLADDMDGGVQEEKAVLRESVVESPEEEAEEEAGALSVPMRENFNETAFFYPQLRTGRDGQVAIAFTLPESLTRWNLLGVAHTSDLNYLNLREEVEARKDLMAQLYLPRFLRPGDEAMLSATVRNVSDQHQKGRGTLQVLDAKTEKVLRTWKVDIRIDSQRDTTFAFGYLSPDNDVVVRWAVEGTTCSDGEQRLLPVLPATMHVTNTIALTAYDPSEQTIDLTGLFPKDVADRRLTVEYTTHPEQYALQALPALARAKRCDVLSLAAAYYAGVLGKELGVKMADSTEVYLQKIQELQDADGAFRWYPDMPVSRYLTLEVSYLFTRLRMLTEGGLRSKVEGLRTKGEGVRSKGEGQRAKVNEKAVHYLLDQRIDSTYLSATDLRTLYVALYSGVELSKQEQKKVNFLMRLAKREDVEEDGYERQALLAIVLKQAGADRKARKCANAFRKYIVSSPQRGSYIEFPKGSFTSIDRKLHIHVQLMEALQRMNPQDTLLRGMRRYLLQQKRTQEWSTPVNTANAVFALLSLPSPLSPLPPKDYLTLTRKGVAAQRFTVEDDTLGYLRDSVEIGERTLPVRLKLKKFGEGESWGAVYADFEQRYDAVEARSEGLSVVAEYPADMKRGNRYKVRYRIAADRDYEYVTLLLPRPAALEPVNQMSGYRWSGHTSLGWSGGLGYYRQVHDATTELSFCQIPRGVYLIEEDVYVERNGTYHSGVSVIRCEYAEEFQGHSDDTTVTVK